MGTENMADQAHLAQLVIRLKFGQFSDEDRKSITDAFRGSQLGQVRIDEAIVTNLGIGGPGGLPLTFDVWLNVAEGTASGLLTYVIASAIKPVLKIAGKRLVQLITAVHKDESEPVTYIAQPADVSKALEAMPADYEEAIRTESRTRIWRDGRWEHYEQTTRIERGSEE